MTTKIQKWGNSYAVRLPKGAVERLQLEEGDEVHVSERKDGSGLFIAPAGAASLPLDALLERITPTNRHEPVSWGAPEGSELW